MRKISILIIYCLSFIYCYGNSNLISQLNIISGLPGSDIRSLYQDSIGYLWLGVDAVGLCRYDGRNFEVHEHLPNDSGSISNNFVWDIACHNNYLWVATEKGLNIMDRQTNVFYKLTSEKNNLNDNFTFKLLFDCEGDLWIGTRNGMNRIPSQELKKLYYLLKHSSTAPAISIDRFLYSKMFSVADTKVKVVNLMEDKFGRIWASTNNGVYCYNKVNQSFKHLKKTKDDVGGLIFNKVNYVTEYSSSEFLIGTDRGACFYNERTESFYKNNLPGITVNSLESKGYNKYLHDMDGLSWMSVSNGLYVFDKTLNRYEFVVAGQNGLQNSSVRALLEDFSGVVWIGTKFGGVQAHQSKKNLFPLITITPDLKAIESNRDNHILSALVDSKGDIWIGTKYKGLFKYNSCTNSFESFRIVSDKLVSNRIECIYEDELGDIWVGTLKGLNKLVRGTNSLKLISFKPIKSILKDANNNFWIGTLSGLYVFDRESETFRMHSSADNHFIFDDENLAVSAIIQDKKNDLWIGTSENGVFVYDISKKVMKHHFDNSTNDKGAIGNMVRALFEDYQGNLWIGTKHNGLYRYVEKEGVFENFSKVNGLSSNSVYNIINDEHDNLWLGTHNGLSFYSRDKNEFFNYNVHHGLQSNVFEAKACAKKTKGQLIFGGHKGFNIFYPDSIKIEEYRAPLVINRIKVNNHVMVNELFHDTIIYLNHDQNFLDFEYALLDFRSPLENRFEYQLMGIDKEMIEAGNRNYVSYSGLKYGEYTFVLNGVGPENHKAQASISVKIVIGAPWWQSGTAIIFYILFITLVVVLVNQLTAARARHSSKMKEIEREFQLSIESNEAKLRFFTNISHDLQSPLSLIDMPAQKLSKSSNLNDMEIRYVDLIRTNTRRLLRLLDQLMYFRKTQNGVIPLLVKKGNLIRFIEEIIYPYRVYAEDHGIRFHFIYSVPELEMWFDPEKLEKIISNLLMNAIKFSEAGCDIEIEVVQVDTEVIAGKQDGVLKKYKVADDWREKVQIKVRDTGKGMTEKELKNIFNRYYSGEHTGSYKGTGIGLEVTQTLVEMHGGTIEATSNSDIGSCFTVSLLKGNSHYKNKNISYEPVSAITNFGDDDISLLLSNQMEKDNNKTGGDDDSKKPIVLLVEDNTDLRRFLGENLSPYYKVLLASNGKDGLDRAIKKIPDLVISDIIMPEMTGIELCVAIKSNVVTSHIPVILLTRKVLIEDKINALKIGADDYVEKPFNLEYLLLRIKHLFETHQKIKKQVLSEIVVGDVDNEKVSSQDKQLLNKLNHGVVDNLSNPKFDVDVLAKIVGLSRSQLYRKILALTGQSPAEFIYSNRLKEAKKILILEKHSIADVAQMCGFKSSNSFSTVFKKHVGMSPSEYIESENRVKLTSDNN